MPSEQPGSALRDILAANSELTMGLLAPLLADVQRGAERITQSFLRDGKLITCGAGTSAAISEYCATIFADRLERERPGLPSFALSSNATLNQSITQNISHHEVLARQVRSLGVANDCLLLFAPGSDSAASVQALSAAHDRGLSIVAITSSGDKDLSAILTPEDLEIHIATDSLARLIEAELLLTHCLCQSVEFLLFGLE